MHPPLNHHAPLQVWSLLGSKILGMSNFELCRQAGLSIDSAWFRHVGLFGSDKGLRLGPFLRIKNYILSSAKKLGLGRAYVGLMLGDVNVGLMVASCRAFIDPWTSSKLPNISPERPNIFPAWPTRAQQMNHENTYPLFMLILMAPRPPHQDLNNNLLLLRCFSGYKVG